ncbi:hypothetical protein PCANC_01818 [Puccinia coronata f. sp. avenae]|uniref:Uncharacterized protein n=1 Tax=Puccinia coronata f. sp. avenae TaxID=200324 RepID=A0A2N5W5B9_9BASI|nr:hypothetical protein PCANC_01818 [Puccinia coronata f. sp. avenae]
MGSCCRTRCDDVFLSHQFGETASCCRINSVRRHLTVAPIRSHRRSLSREIVYSTPNKSKPPTWLTTTFNFLCLAQSVFFCSLAWRVALTNPGLHDQAEAGLISRPNLEAQVSQAVNSGIVYHTRPDGNQCDTYGNNLRVETHPTHLDGCDSSCYPMPSSGRKRVAESQYDKSSLHPSYEQHSSSMSNPQAFQGNEIGIIPDSLSQHEYPKLHDNVWNGGYEKKRRLNFIDFLSVADGHTTTTGDYSHKSDDFEVEYQQENKGPKFIDFMEEFLIHSIRMKK